tara:strand:+ start:72 stop:950 length:879 start_codon:yes stop_codon:yes gene_type:complete
MTEPQTTVFSTKPRVVGDADFVDHSPKAPVEEAVTTVLSNDWINDEYKHLIVTASPKSLTAKPGQFFHWLCPSPDEGDLWLRRPQSVYLVDKENQRLEFLYKTVGRGTKGTAMLEPGDQFNMVGPLGVGFTIQPDWKHVVVLGRGVGLATLAPISQMITDNSVGATVILSARSPELAMSGDLFEKAGAEIITVTDTDGSSDIANVEAIIEDRIAQGRADAFYTCGSNRLFMLMKRLGEKHDIPGQVAMEQIMACGLGPCYVCVRTFEIDGVKTLKRVCIDGPVFDIKEAMGW